MIEPEIRKYFPTSKAVNEALKSLIKIIPDKQKKIPETSKTQDNNLIETVIYIRKNIFII